MRLRICAVTFFALFLNNEHQVQGKRVDSAKFDDDKVEARGRRQNYTSDALEGEQEFSDRDHDDGVVYQEDIEYAEDMAYLNSLDEHTRELQLTFFDTFEPKDWLTSDIDAHSSQTYSLKVTQQPSVIKIIMFVKNEDPEPITVKLYKIDKSDDEPVGVFEG